MCNNCGQSYKHKCNLVAHQKFECGVQPKYNYDICTRKFAHRAQVQNHQFRFHKISRWNNSMNSKSDVYLPSIVNIINNYSFMTNFEVTIVTI